MWESFVDKGYWVVVAIAIGAGLFFLLWRSTPWLVHRLVPEALRDQQDQKAKLTRTVKLAVAIIGGIILALGIAAFVVALYGVDIGTTMKSVGDWLIEHGIRIFIIILVGWFVYKILGIIMPLFVMRYVVEKGKRRRSKVYLRQRSRTLGRVVTQAIGIFIILIGGFMILSELGVDITPLLASAGVAGIVIGLAAQDAVRDFINGFTIMMEDHYNVGDVIKASDLVGEVEEMGLRRTVLRDLKGLLHVIPNGEIRISSNYTRSISRAFFEVDVAYKEDLDRVMDIVRHTWEDLAADPEWESKIISKTPWLLRVEDFGDSGITIRCVGDTRPMEQWGVMGELRRRIKRVFDEKGVEIPWPHVKLYMGEEEPVDVAVTKPEKKPKPAKPRKRVPKSPKWGEADE
ncbi:MAG: mechanosensitive ion channel family protein [Dehalococcoidia bacterium]|jgi:small conductance mechanosensitive channel